ncbi:MAG: hypothetical protein M3Y64_09975 [Gemmatimonadota bacterium]|nr:hypothetical protein [Gemmatimonadota bacterium]
MSALETSESGNDARANAPVTEIAERFLRAILTKVPIDRIEELHLFSPLRQGTVETGIAVIAARAVVVEQPAAAPSVDTEPVESESSEPLPADVEVPNNDELIAPEVATEIVHAVDGGIDGMPAADDNFVLGTDADELAALNAEPGDDSPYADEGAATRLTALSETADEDEPDVPRVRHTVYTARYRLVVKGPERGKWEIDVVDEADAPLLTVETVVRGVQRRAGEETATVRYDAAALRHALRIKPADNS